MKIPTYKIQRIWALSMAGNPEAMAEMQKLHARYPELNERYALFRAAINRIRSGEAKKRKKTRHKAEPTTWTRAQDKFESSTAGNVVIVQGGATGLKR